MKHGLGGSYLDHRSDGWWIIEVGTTWNVKHGPYRWKWIAAIVLFVVRNTAVKHDETKL